MWLTIKGGIHFLFF